MPLPAARRPTRLTQWPEAPGGAVESAPLYFRRLKGRMLVTNDGGYFASLSEEDFSRLLAGTLEEGEPAWAELRDNGFIRSRLDFEALARHHLEKNLLRWPGPMVHTVVATLRCNLKCVYCHASVVGLGARGKDMTLEIARKTVDFIFQSPNPELMIEFQGGEPLLNWPAVRLIVEYARKRNEREKRRLNIALISNFTLLDDEKLDFLASRKVSFCTSLDGPEELHEANRIFLGGNTHEKVVGWIRRLQELRARGLAIDKPNAIATITRKSLGCAEAIVDQAARLGLERVQLGPLDPIGFARGSWGAIGYSPEEFCVFYRRALDRVLELCRRGERLYEKTALILLIRILERGRWRFPDAEGLCRLGYNFDGDIFVSEEGRLLANEGNPFFRCGSVSTSSYGEILDHPVLRATFLAAQTQAQPLCSQCAYGPFCTVLPVQNLQTQGSPWGRMPSNSWCRTIMGVFDILFEKLDDPAARPILESWVKEYRDK